MSQQQPIKSRRSQSEYFFIFCDLRILYVLTQCNELFPYTTGTFFRYARFYSQPHSIFISHCSLHAARSHPFPFSEYSPNKALSTRSRALLPFIFPANRPSSVHTLCPKMLLINFAGARVYFFSGAAIFVTGRVVRASISIWSLQRRIAFGLLSSVG